MPRPTREELRLTLKQMGEETPKSWTKTDIQFRIEELQKLHGETPSKGDDKTSLEQWCKELRRAARKKATLVEFCTEELGMSLTGNEVMSKMEMKAMEVIMRRCPAEAQDLVGFGKHSEERYQTIRDKFADYAKWVVTTWKESGNDGVDPRLARLASWLEEQGRTTEDRGHVAKTKAEGYLTKDMIKTKEDAETASSSQTKPNNKGATASASQLEKQMAMMADTMELMRRELAEMKGERPRKTQGRVETEDEAMTEDSFRMVHPVPAKKS